MNDQFDKLLNAMLTLPPILDAGKPAKEVPASNAVLSASSGDTQIPKDKSEAISLTR